MVRRNKKHGPRGQMTDDELELVVRAYLEYDDEEFNASKRARAMEAVSFGRTLDFMRDIERCIRQGRFGRGNTQDRAINLYNELTSESIVEEDKFGVPAEQPQEYSPINEECEGVRITITFDGNTFTMESKLSPIDIVNKLGIKEFHCTLDN